MEERKEGENVALRVNWLEFGGASAARYHYTYHYSVGIHVNHMIFLNTYLLGWFLMMACIPATSTRVEIPAAAAGVYAAYSTLLNGFARGITHGLFCSGLAATAVYFRREVVSESTRATGIWRYLEDLD